MNCLMPSVLAILLLAFASSAFAGGDPGEPEPLKQPPAHINKPFKREIPKQTNKPLNEIVEILPEVATHVRLSSTDVNRIICPSKIKDVVYSKEKGVEVKVSGSNAFVKFLVKKSSGGKEEYSSTPTEFFVACGGDVYTVIAVPLRIPSRTIKLSTGVGKRIKDNATLFKSLPFEKKILMVIEKMYRGDIPESFMVKRVNEAPVEMDGVSVTLVRTVDIEGEGLRGKEFLVSIKNGHPLNLFEKDFLKTKLTKKPLALSLNKLRLNGSSDKARLFIVERAVEE